MSNGKFWIFKTSNFVSGLYDFTLVFNELAAHCGENGRAYIALAELIKNYDTQGAYRELVSDIAKNSDTDKKTKSIAYAVLAITYDEDQRNERLANLNSESEDNVNRKSLIGYLFYYILQTLKVLLFLSFLLVALIFLQKNKYININIPFLTAVMSNS